MANLTSVTNPVPGKEPTNYRSPIQPNDPRIQNIPDPTRVGRADARTDRQDTANTGARRYDSNFQAFIENLRQSSSVAEIASRMLSSGQSMLVTSGLSAGMAQELSQFLQMLQVGPEELLELMRGQVNASARFGGALFDALRDALDNNPSAGLKNDILQFLRKYNDYSSTGHIARNMQREIKQMTWFMPGRFSEQLSEQLGQLENMIAQGNRSGALSLLQNTLIPYMSDYVSQMHDRGVARSLLSMLVLDIARYENGSPQNMLQSFYQLLGYSPLKTHFGQLSGSEMTELLQDSSAHINNMENPLADQIARLAAMTTRGEGTSEMKQAFQALMESILVNQSVYMPLAHAMLPVEMDGRMMFSELWVDPNAEDETSGGASGREKPMRLLLKFDIQELGLFDLVMTLRGDRVDVSLGCPAQLSEFTKLFESKMSAFAEKEGLKTSNVLVAPMQRPITLTEVFPKIFEKKDSINVSV